MENSRFRIPVLLILFTLISCSIVKENRDSCPCNLQVELTGVQDTETMLLVKSVRDSSYARLMTVSRDTMFTLLVPRGGITLSAWSGANAGDAVLIPEGSQAPPLYLYHGKVNAVGELAYAGVKLHKQFCTLSIEVQGPPGWGPPIGTEIRGSVGGMSLAGAILPGSYRCSPSGPSLADENTVRIGSVRIPRQMPDSSLMLDIVMEDNVIRTFSLGAYLLKAGYNWIAPDLADITVHMDLAVSAITFSANGFSAPIPVTVDI
jgi:hypothetical protein